MEIAQKVVTWDDYLQLPDELQHYEIVDGGVIELGAPDDEHQICVRRLLRLLEDFTMERQLGEVLPVPFDVIVQRDPVRTRQPDLFFLRKERGGTIENLRQLARLEIAPDLVVEIISPSEETGRLLDKVDDYHSIGVQEVWLVYTQQQVVEVLGWQEEGWRWLGVFNGKGKVKSKVLPDLDFSVERIFT